MLHRTGRAGGVPLLALLAAVLLAAPGALAQADKKPENAGPYVPTPWSIVDRMLTLPGIGAQDFVVDLGSGDGRLVIAAVERYGARGGFGVDIDAELVKVANEGAARAGVADRVRFLRQDLFATDVSPASVVTLYLLPHIVTKLVPKLLAELKPGSRVVSHDYPLDPWPHDRRIDMEVPEKVNISGTPRTILFLYTVPARLSGTWELTLPPALAARPVDLAIEQDAAGARGTVGAGGRRQPLASLDVQGTRVVISVPPLVAGAKALVLRGTADDRSMTGTIDAMPEPAGWRARRTAP
jgi:SAM-dependent methyltransferase